MNLPRAADSLSDSSLSSVRAPLLALREALDALKAIDDAVHSHIDGRDLLEELHPRHHLDIKRRVDGRETWHEADWMSGLRLAIQRARPVMATADALLARLSVEPEERKAMTDDVKAALLLAQDAIRWCSGSADFNEGGQAREGWIAPGGPRDALDAIDTVLQSAEALSPRSTPEGERKIRDAENDVLVGVNEALDGTGLSIARVTNRQAEIVGYRIVKIPTVLKPPPPEGRT